MEDVFDPAYAEQLQAVAPDEHYRRREFLQRLAGAAGVGLGLAAGLGVQPLIAEAARAERRPLPSPRNLPIDTIVVVMMENRSFDHLLGWMPKADGRQAGLTYLNSAGQSFSTYPLAPDFQGCGHQIPGHIWNQGRVQLNGGAANGWLLDGSGNDAFAIGYYREQDLKVLPSLARSFTTYDRYFASLLASTNPNRSYMHAAQSYGEKYLLLMPGDGLPSSLRRPASTPRPRSKPASRHRAFAASPSTPTSTTRRSGARSRSSARGRSPTTSSWLRADGCPSSRSSIRSCTASRRSTGSRPTSIRSATSVPARRSPTTPCAPSCARPNTAGGPVPRL